jgi:hypothetical protein
MPKVFIQYLENTQTVFECVHCKKGYRFSRPQPGCHLPNSSWQGIIKSFTARESLVRDIPAGDGKMANLFLQCMDNIPIEACRLFLAYFRPKPSFFYTSQAIVPFQENGPFSERS